MGTSINTLFKHSSCKCTPLPPVYTSVCCMQYWLSVLLAACSLSTATSVRSVCRQHRCVRVVMFHMQRRHIYIQAFCYSRKTKNSFQVSSNKQKKAPVVESPSPSILCEYNKTMQSFTGFHQLGVKRTRNSSVHWHEPWKGASLFSEAGWGGGAPKHQPTNQQRWGLAAGSVCYETAFCPFQSEVFLSTSSVRSTSSQTWSQNTFSLRYCQVRRDLPCKANQNRPKHVQSSPWHPLFC